MYSCYERRITQPNVHIIHSTGMQINAIKCKENHLTPGALGVIYYTANIYILYLRYESYYDFKVSHC